MDRRIDLDRARRDAKALLRAARAGDAEALERLRADRAPRLADAQQAVARELGEQSWAALVRRVEADVVAAVDDILELVAAGEHHAALKLARAHPRAAARLRATSAAALIDAAREGRAGAVATLLELGVEPNHRDPGSRGTALHVAASMGWADVVDVLVGWVPLDLHARDAAGRTALGACAEGSARAPRERAGAHLVIAKMLASVGLRVGAGMLDRGSEEVAAWLTAQAARPAPRPLGQEHGEAAWSAAVAASAHVARSPLAERRPAGDGFAFRTGLFDNTRNGVVCSRLPADAADAAIEELVSWFAGHRTPAQWLIAAQTEPPDLGTRLERAGCRPERSAVFMAADLTNGDLADPRLPAGVEIEPLRDAAALAAAFAGAEALDDDPEQRERRLALLTSTGLGDKQPLQHYAARLPEGPVGIVSSLTAQPTLLLTDLAVAAHARRRGIGRALVLHALHHGRSQGCRLALLDPTPATVPFYEALGFALERFPPGRSFYLP